MNLPQPESEMPRTDDLDSIIIIVDGPSQSPPRPLDPHLWKELRKKVDSYAVEPEKLAKVQRAARSLGISKADLICEGLDLVLEKYRDKLGDLLAPGPPTDAPKPENGSPSA